MVFQVEICPRRVHPVEHFAQWILMYVVMFEARLAGNLQGSPKWFARCFVILSVFFLSSLRFRSRGIETTLRTLVESHEERGKKHWRFWEVAFPLGRNGSEVHMGAVGGGWCWWNISSNSPVCAVRNQINGIFMDIFSLHQQVWCIFINQIQVVVSNLLFSFRFWIFFWHFKPLWEDSCQFECRLPTSFWARSTEADRLCMVHLRKLTWTPNILIVERKFFFQNTILRVHVSFRKCILEAFVCFNFGCNGTDVMYSSWWYLRKKVRHVHYTWVFSSRK